MGSSPTTMQPGANPQGGLPKNLASLISAQGQQQQGGPRITGATGLALPSTAFGYPGRWSTPPPGTIPSPDAPGLVESLSAYSPYIQAIRQAYYGGR